MFSPLRCHSTHLFIWIFAVASGTIQPHFVSQFLEQTNLDEDTQLPLATAAVYWDSPVPSWLAESANSAHIPAESPGDHVLSFGANPMPHLVPSPRRFTSMSNPLQEVVMNAGKRKFVPVSIEHSNSNPTSTTNVNNSRQRLLEQAKFVTIADRTIEAGQGSSTLSHGLGFAIASQHREKKPHKLNVDKRNPPGRHTVYPQVYVNDAFLDRAYKKFLVNWASFDPHFSDKPQGNSYHIQLTAKSNLYVLDGTVRIVNSSTGIIQSFHHCMTLYKNLIRWLHKGHEQLMNRLDLPTYMQRSQQEKLFGWLDDQIFHPPTGLPILGKVTVSPDTLPARELHHYPFIQSTLIECFAQDPYNDLLVRSTASLAIILFQAEHPNEYEASRYPLEVSTRITTNPEFQTIQSFFISTFTQVHHDKLASLDSNEHVLEKSCAHFKAHLFKSSFHPSQLRTIHPKLSVVMGLVGNKSDPQLFRVVCRQDKRLIKNHEALAKFKKLIKAIYSFHLEFLLSLDNPQELQSRMKTILEWVLESIANPTDSLCIFGHAKINEDLAPWEEVSKGNLFGEAQLELIDYFSEPSPGHDAHSSAIVLLCLWYKKYHDDDFEHLFRIVESYKSLIK